VFIPPFLRFPEARVKHFSSGVGSIFFFLYVPLLLQEYI